MLIEPTGLSYDGLVRYILPASSPVVGSIGVWLPADFVCFIVEIFAMKSALLATRLRFDILFCGKAIGAEILLGMPGEGGALC